MTTDAHRAAPLPLAPLQQLDKARCGILIGSAFGGMSTFATAVEALETQSEQQQQLQRACWVAPAEAPAGRSSDYAFQLPASQQPTSLLRSVFVNAQPAVPVCREGLQHMYT